MKQAKLFQPDAHGDWGNDETLGQRLAEAFQRLVFCFRNVEIANGSMDARNLDEGARNWRFWLEDALLPVRKELVPRGKDHLARHQQAGGIEIGLPFHPLLCLARPADELGFARGIKEGRLRRVLHDQVLMQPPVPAALVGQREAIAALPRGVLLRIEAFVDEYASVAVDRAEDVGLAVRRARNIVARVHVVEINPQLEVLFHDVLNRDGRLDRHAPSALILSDK